MRGAFRPGGDSTEVVPAGSSRRHCHDIPDCIYARLYAACVLYPPCFTGCFFLQRDDSLFLARDDPDDSSRLS